MRYKDDIKAVWDDQNRSEEVNAYLFLVLLVTFIALSMRNIGQNIQAEEAEIASEDISEMSSVRSVPDH